MFHENYVDHTWSTCLSVCFRDVHIIELHSANTSPRKSTAIPDVVVQIRAKVKSPKQHHIVLVLKSHERVKWHISIRGIRGELDVIVSVCLCAPTWCLRMVPPPGVWRTLGCLFYIALMHSAVWTTVVNSWWMGFCVLIAVWLNASQSSW